MKVRELVRRIYRQFKKNWKDTYWWKRLLLRWIRVFYYRRVIGNKGKRVMEEDWDNMIILDACRYDLFMEVAALKVDYIISRGSSTAEFLKENFVGHKYANTVVVTANPNVDRFVRNCFYRLISVWKSGWDDKLSTVLPKTMVKAALEAEKKYPDKRLIVWFIQPHIPFIENPEIFPYGMKRPREMAEFNKSDIPISSPWVEADRGNLRIEKVWQAYKRNLEIVLPCAYELAQQLSGKTIITSDHGNTFERLWFPFPVRIVGHPSGIHIQSLIKVPWLVFEGKERKKIREGLPSERERIKGRLRKLRGSF